MVEGNCYVAQQPKPKSTSTSRGREVGEGQPDAQGVDG